MFALLPYTPPPSLPASVHGTMEGRKEGSHKRFLGTPSPPSFSLCVNAWGRGRNPPLLSVGRSPLSLERNLPLPSLFNCWTKWWAGCLAGGSVAFVPKKEGGREVEYMAPWLSLVKEGEKGRKEGRPFFFFHFSFPHYISREEEGPVSCFLSLPFRTCKKGLRRGISSSKFRRPLFLRFCILALVV